LEKLGLILKGRLTEGLALILVLIFLNFKKRRLEKLEFWKGS